MSLINEMLQDLDARKQISEPESVTPDSNAGISPLNSDRWRLAPVLLGFVLAAAMGFFMVQHLGAGVDSPQPRVPIELTQSESAADHKKSDARVNGAKAAGSVTPSVIALETEHAEISANSIAGDVKPKAIVAQGGKTEKINELLREAEIALSENRLSLPRGQSAYDLYQQIIAMDKDNSPALSGLKQIKNRYIALIDNALEEKKVGRAEKLVNRVEGLSLQLEPSELSGYRDQIKTQRQFLVDAKTQPQKATPVTHEEPQLAINKTLASRELAIAREAQQLLARGRGREAVVQLEGFIASNTTTNLSRIVLFDYYLDQTRLSQARALLQPAYAMAASTRVYMQARLAMISSSNAAAIALLEKVKPEPTTTEIYNALLVGLYQKEKAHDKAVPLYASLIETNPSNVTYWLGMGVSRDALGEYQPALNAYNVVITHKHLDESVRRFVKARIQALSSQASSSQDLAEAGVAW